LAAIRCLLDGRINLEIEHDEPITQGTDAQSTCRVLHGTLTHDVLAKLPADRSSTPPDGLPHAEGKRARYTACASSSIARAWCGIDVVVAPAHGAHRRAVCIPSGMRWDRSHESSDVEDRRSQSGSPGFGGGGIPLGGLLALGSRFGWKGILIALLLAGVLGYGGLCTGGEPTSRAPVATSPGTGSTEDNLAKFVGFVLDDVQQTWARELPDYQRAHLVLFRDAIGSGCGSASAAVGPFYCPLDRKVYIDLSFYDQLRRRFGAPGDFAQAYVIAHEVGHHVQNLRGLLGRGEVSSIATELQADCLAGAWAQDAQRRELLEVGDIDEALNAAAQIGDDTIQRKTQGRVQPETWTHGSAAQRSSSFKKGLEGGARACGV
jgi:predicted metalloprotease